MAVISEAILGFATLLKNVMTYSLFAMKHISLILAVFFFAAPVVVFAHERQLFSIGGTDYLFVVGSLNEPIVVDDKTGVDLRILIADPTDPTNTKAPGAKPATGLESALKVELIAGERKKVFDLAPAYNDPGAYRAVFFPTIETTYTYRVFGTLHGTEVNLPFTCNPAGHVAAPEEKTEVVLENGVVRKFKAGQFGCPLAKGEMGFPEPTMAITDLHGDAEHHVAEVHETAAAAKRLSGIGIALGLLGLLLSAFVFVRSRRPVD